MNGARVGWNEVLFGGLLVTALIVLGLPPLHGFELPLPLAIACGVATGALLFRSLAGSRGSLPACAQLRAALIGASGATLAIRAVLEELAWRGFLLGALVGPLTPAPALVVASGLFALAHSNARGRRRLVHLVTGGVFGGVYLLTGRVAAAAAAHVAYNGLIAAAIWRPAGR